MSSQASALAENHVSTRRCGSSTLPSTTSRRRRVQAIADGSTGEFERETSAHQCERNWIVPGEPGPFLNTIERADPLAERQRAVAHVQRGGQEVGVLHDPASTWPAG